MGSGMAALSYGIRGALGESGENSGAEQQASEPFRREAQLHKYAGTASDADPVDPNTERTEARLFPFPPGPKTYGGGTGQFLGALGGWFVGAELGAKVGLAIGMDLGFKYGFLGGPLGSFWGGVAGGFLGGGIGGVIGGFIGAQSGGSLGHLWFDSPCAGALNCGEPVVSGR